MLAAVLADVYARRGEPEAALAQLAMVAQLPSGPSYGDLQCNPRWDPLRNDPRFGAIRASLQPQPPRERGGGTRNWPAPEA